jgi:adenine-specific DNA-methyltransferase
VKKETINDNSNITANSKQIELLKKYFPQCFDKKGAFILHKMQEIVGESGQELSKESYSLNWLGKSYARLLANENPRTLLAEDKPHNLKPENQNSENLLIKGDNLEVMKHLVNAYSEQVKMIYIDPPYNTGEDGFVYQDDRKFTVDELSKLAGIETGEAKRILDFTQSEANSHSAWLTFMYPRLYVARELLSENGTIFISVDDNELAQLKKLCDDVFGAENFIANFIWEKRTNRENRKTVSSRHDYILCYCNDGNKKTRRIKQLPMSEKALSSYKNLGDDPRGRWKSDPAHAQAGHGTKDQFYVLVAPNGKEHELESGRCWVYTKPVMDEAIRDNRIWFGKDGNGVPRIKTYLNSKERGLTPETIWFASDVATNEIAKNLLKELFDGKAVFETPKPVDLVVRMLLIATDANDLVLDFFAGSGTTAHAVMQLNAVEGGSRRCISVQLPEETDKKSEAYKTGYKTIFDITRVRIEKAALKTKTENPDYTGDLGFKIYETIPVPDGYLDDIDELDSQQPLFDGSKLDDNQLDHLLTTWKVYDGMALTQELIPVSLSKYTAWYFDKKLYLMHDGFTTDALKALIEKLDGDKGFCPAKVVLFGYNFDSKHQREIKEGLGGYTNKKNIDVDVTVRY